MLPPRETKIQNPSLLIIHAVPKDTFQLAAGLDPRGANFTTRFTILDRAKYKNPKTEIKIRLYRISNSDFEFQYEGRVPFLVSSAAATMPAAATAATAAVAASAATPAATPAFGPRPGFIHGQGAAAGVLA